MAHFTIERKSSALGKESCIHVLAPNAPVEQPLKVLYLLHGLSDDASCWSRYSSVELFVRNESTVVVMPDGGRSFYADTAYGENYFTYLTQELPEWIRFMFPVSEKREDTFIAGLSMGGYGALKTALTYPERYGGVAGFSSVCDVRKRSDELIQMTATLGHDPDWDALDLFTLAKKAEKAPQKPKIYQWCGTSDFLYQENKEFQKLMETLDYDYSFFESEGDHMWRCWNEQIQKAMVFFGLCSLS